MEKKNRVDIVDDSQPEFLPHDDDDDEELAKLIMAADEKLEGI